MMLNILLVSSRELEDNEEGDVWINSVINE